MRIIILGGGFCGSLIAKNLDTKKNIEVVLIDKKEYFEYSPSLWKLLINKENYKKYTVPFTQFLRHTRLITTSTLRVTPHFVETEAEKLTYDYLVISTGIEYPIYLENTTNVITVKSGVDVVKNNEKITEAKTIVVIGGGLIGTEVAAELVTKYPEKHILLVHPHNRLLERNKMNVSNFARRFLESHGISLLMGEKVIDHQNNTFITNAKRTIPADIGIWCAGIKSNPWFMKEFPSSVFTKNNALKVNHFLQLEGYTNIFVGGDITNIMEEKTALNAERHGSLISTNLLRSIKKRRLLVYKSRILPMIVDLGSTNAMLTYRLFFIPGVIPAVLKLIVEKILIKRLSFR